MRGVGLLFSVRSFVLKAVAILVLLAAALIPFWIWLFFYHALSPVGFWQKLVVYGLGMWYLWVAQLLFLAGFVIATIFILAAQPWYGRRR